MSVQVYLTQVYSGTGSADTLSAFLIPQYALMFVTMTVLCAYSLQLIYWFQMVVQIYLVDTLDIFFRYSFFVVVIDTVELDNGSHVRIDKSRVSFKKNYCK